jgi:hypothetical protein
LNCHAGLPSAGVYNSKQQRLIARRHSQAKNVA